MHSARHVDEQCLYGATSAAEDAERFGDARDEDEPR